MCHINPNPYWRIHFYYYSSHYSWFRARKCQPTADLISICPQTGINNIQPVWGWRVLNELEIPAVVCFLGRYYRNKLVITQIPHIAGLEAIPYAGTKLLPCRNRINATSRSMGWKYHVLIRLTIGPGLLFH